MLSKFRMYENKLIASISSDVKHKNEHEIRIYMISQEYNRLTAYYVRRLKIANCSYGMVTVFNYAVMSNRNTVKYFLSRLGKKKREACINGILYACHRGYRNLVDYFLKLKETRPEWLECLYFAHKKNHFDIMNYLYVKGPKFLKDEKVRNALKQYPEYYNDFANILNSDSDEDD